MATKLLIGDHELERGDLVDIVYSDQRVSSIHPGRINTSNGRTHHLSDIEITLKSPVKKTPENWPPKQNDLWLDGDFYWHGVQHQGRIDLRGAFANSQVFKAQEVLDVFPNIHLVYRVNR